jgi:hypothetical protein
MSGRSIKIITIKCLKFLGKQSPFMCWAFWLFQESRGKAQHVSGFFPFKTIDY